MPEIVPERRLPQRSAWTDRGVGRVKRSGSWLSDAYRRTGLREAITAAAAAGTQGLGSAAGAAN